MLDHKKRDLEILSEFLIVHRYVQSCLIIQCKFFMSLNRTIVNLTSLPPFGPVPQEIQHFLWYRAKVSVSQNKTDAYWQKNTPYWSNKVHSKQFAVVNNWIACFFISVALELELVHVPVAQKEREKCCIRSKIRFSCTLGS